MIEETVQALKGYSGLKLYCPQCHEAEASIQSRLDAPSEFHCMDCDTDFDADEVVAVVEGALNWIRVLNMLNRGNREWSSHERPTEEGTANLAGQTESDQEQ